MNDLYSHIDTHLLPQATHVAPVWRWSEEVQKRIFEIFEDSGKDVIANAHRTVEIVVSIGQAMALTGAGLATVCLFLLDGMWSAGGVWAVLAGGAMILFLTLFVSGVVMVAHLQTASAQDFKNIRDLKSKIRKAGVWLDWAAPHKYEYSVMLWYLDRLRVEQSRAVREKLMAVAGVKRNQELSTVMNNPKI